MDGSLSTLLNPDQFRRDCFTQYRDMKSMDPAELLGILPTCHFGRFCSTKYLSIVHPKMEESLFGNLEQQSQSICSVVSFSGGTVPPGYVVGFPVSVSPGFKLGNGSIIKARVYLMSLTLQQ
ncbi:hypothetical protein HN51_023583 [Arachis hypogaea]